MTFQQEIELKTINKSKLSIDREIKSKEDQLNKLIDSKSFIEVSRIYSELNGLIKARSVIDLF